MRRADGMRLTAELAAAAARLYPPGTPGPMPDGRRFATDDDHMALIDSLLADAGPDGVWLFAYGSLIWNPCFDHVEQRSALARGLRRSFCLGWTHHFRGCLERPGLMLALDRGGSCRGVAYRLPDDALRENLLALMKREMLILPHPFPPRWVRVSTAAGEVRALTFVMDRRSGMYVGGLDEERTADILAVAAGEWGSMAEYLHNTVTSLDALGIRDGHLWRLQDLVADRLEEAAARAAEGGASV